MSDTSNPPVRVDAPVQLPPVVWIGGHPTVEDPETRGTRLRRCLRCNTRELFHSVSCAPGLIVHLIDPADVHAAPEVFDGSAWAEPDAISSAHAHWRDKGYRVVRKPDGPVGERVHPRFRVCPRCNEEAMAAGSLAPVYLPAAAAPPRLRGRAAR